MIIIKYHYCIEDIRVVVCQSVRLREVDHRNLPGIFLIFLRYYQQDFKKLLFSDNNEDSLFSQMSLGELAGIQVSDMESSYDVSFVSTVLVYFLLYSVFRTPELMIVATVKELPQLLCY